MADQHERSRVAELVTRVAEVEHELDQLRGDIDEHLPAYALDDGTGDEAGHRERIEYAGDELRHLRARVRGLEPHAYAGDDAQYYLHTDRDASEEER